jgi:hypothetical protein
MKTKKLAIAIIIGLGLLTVFAASALPKTRKVQQSTAKKKRKVAVIDSGLNYSDEYFKGKICEQVDFTGTDMNDPYSHGTNVAGIIAKDLKSDECLMILKVYSGEHDRSSLDHVVKALRYATENGAIAINMSMDGEEGHPRELKAILSALSEGIHVFVPSGNKGLDLNSFCGNYPACYKIKDNKFHVVGSYNDWHRNIRVNNGSIVTDRYEGVDQEGAGITASGTSQATANATANYLKKTRQTDFYDVQ